MKIAQRNIYILPIYKDSMPTTYGLVSLMTIKALIGHKMLKYNGKLCGYFENASFVMKLQILMRQNRQLAKFIF